MYNYKYESNSNLFDAGCIHCSADAKEKARATRKFTPKPVSKSFSRNSHKGVQLILLKRPLSTTNFLRNMMLVFLIQLEIQFLLKSRIKEFLDIHIARPLMKGFKRLVHHTHRGKSYLSNWFQCCHSKSNAKLQIQCYHLCHNHPKQWADL